MNKTWIEYLAEKGLGVADLATKTAGELAALHQDYSDQKIKSIEDSIGEKVSKSELKASQTEIKAMKDELISAQTEIKAMKETGRSESKGFATMKDALTEAFKPHESIFKSWHNDGKKQTEPLTVSIKAAVTVSTLNTIDAGPTNHTLSQNTGIVAAIRKRETQYLANVSVGRVSTGHAYWVDEKDEQGNIIFLAEGASKTQVSVRYEEDSMKVKKVAAHVKVTTEMMADLPQFISYIENNLLRRLDIKTEDDLFTGDGTGDNLKGLISYATLFSAGPEAATVPDANEYDVLDALTTQVEVAFGSANAVYVHPRTVSKLRKLKDDNGLYIFPKTLPDALMEVNGMKILKSTAIGVDEFVGGDLSVVNVLIREDLGLQIGLDGNDFTSNKKTMLAEKRLVQFVSANDTQVIVKGDFTTAKASLLKV